MFKKIKAKMFLALPVLALSLQAHGKIEITTAEKNEIMRGARVWSDPGPVALKDMFNGPGFKYVPDQQVTCQFWDGFYKELDGTGLTQKFWCLEPGKTVDDSIKVKYGTKNGEVFAEVVASRLLWALGFYADTAYPLQVSCVNCPDNPWEYLNEMAAYKSEEERGGQSERKERAAQYILDSRERLKSKQESTLRKTGKPYVSNYVGLSEEKFAAKSIYEAGKTKAGFNLLDLNLIRGEAGGSTKAEVEALQLLLAFIKHSDNKFENQRLACPETEVINVGGRQSCAHPVAVMQDMGATFGNGSSMIVVGRFITENSKLAYNNWKKTKVWRDLKTCTPELTHSIRSNFGSEEIHVTEAGRKFLADLMSQLSDVQITAMFTAARVQLRQGSDMADVNQWVQLFKEKRAEIVNARCGN